MGHTQSQEDGKGKPRKTKRLKTTEMLRNQRDKWMSKFPGESTNSFSSTAPAGAYESGGNVSFIDGPDESEERREELCMESLMSFIEKDVSSESDEEDENDMEPYGHNGEYQRPRRGAVSEAATGVWNPRRAGKMPPTVTKTDEQKVALRKALQACPFFKGLEPETMRILIDVMPLEDVPEGKKIIQQGDLGDTGYVILEGSCYPCDESQDGQNHIYGNSEPPTNERGPNGERTGSKQGTKTINAGKFFGEIAMLWGTKRTVSIIAKERCILATLDTETYTDVVVLRSIAERNMRTDCLRRTKLLETLDDESITLIADALEQKDFKTGEHIISQGEWGHTFYVVQAGECSATVSTGKELGSADVQEHRRYGPGELFGERALLQRTYRAATVTAVVDTQVLELSRKKFDRLLGPLDALGAEHYLTDPRKNIADFYRQGDSIGPNGSKTFASKKTQQLKESQEAVGFSGITEWFAVYRPTSRHAISKMLSGTSVGKGLNVKGKSAKGGRLSGYVPFLQIHENSHKKDIEKSPEDARVTIFFQSEWARDQALKELENEQVSGSTNCSFDMVDHYEKMFGMEVPELCLRKAYIDKPDLTFLAGWETGRNSEPAFMDMNLHAVRGKSDPQVVLYQVDTDDPMNPQGLLIAYAEAFVKPVVSDFDTFLVGSKGMIYEELPAEQAQLASWTLDHTLEILENVDNRSWNSRWLDVLRQADENGEFTPEVPKYGFGDATSYRLTTEVIQATIESGAVRHGAECFNFKFPQELDEEFLVVWEKYPNVPWIYVGEESLRQFLLERIQDGFSFPLNPVWPVRDPGWFDVFEALQGKVESAINLSKWLPQGSGLMDKMKAIHASHPKGFYKKSEDIVVPSATKGEWGELRKRVTQVTRMIKLQRALDLEGCERADFLEHQLTCKKRGSDVSLKAAAFLSGGGEKVEDHI